MVNHDIATVREFMFYARPQIMERLFLQLIKKNFDQPRKVPPPSELPQNIESLPFCSLH